MFGLTVEKLFLVALLAAVIIGPRRLPEYARRLGGLIRRLTVLAGDAARRAEQETGVAAIRQDWTALDPRQYDPRRIIREAWAAPATGSIPRRRPCLCRPRCSCRHLGHGRIVRPSASRLDARGN